MGTGRTDEFRKYAVRIALNSGLSRRQVADDLGVGLSTLNKWVNAHRDTDVVSAEDRELARENERLRREIRSERQLMEQMQYNLLFRWFVGLGIDDAVWVPAVFTKNRDRLLRTEM